MNSSCLALHALSAPVSYLGSASHAVSKASRAPPAQHIHTDCTFWPVHRCAATLACQPGTSACSRPLHRTPSPRAAAGTRCVPGVMRCFCRSADATPPHVAGMPGLLEHPAVHTCIECTNRMLHPPKSLHSQCTKLRISFGPRFAIERGSGERQGYRSKKHNASHCYSGNNDSTDTFKHFKTALAHQVARRMLLQRVQCWGAMRTALQHRRQHRHQLHCLCNTRQLVQAHVQHQHTATQLPVSLPPRLAAGSSVIATSRMVLAALLRVLLAVPPAAGAC